MDFGVPGDRARAAEDWIPPYGLIRALAKEFTALPAKVFDECLSFHSETAIDSRIT